MEITPDEDDDPVETLLFSLVYCSRARNTLDPAEIERIVSVAQRNNARQQITGLLVYSSGIFFQWLEGHQQSVESLMSTINCDERHNTIVVLDRAAEVRERLFSGWSMELVAPEDIREVLLDAMRTATDSKSAAALRKLMKELDSRTMVPGA